MILKSLKNSIDGGKPLLLSLNTKVLVESQITCLVSNQGYHELKRYFNVLCPLQSKDEISFKRFLIEIYSVVVILKLRVCSEVYRVAYQLGVKDGAKRKCTKCQMYIWTNSLPKEAKATLFLICGKLQPVHELQTLIVFFCFPRTKPSTSKTKDL